MRFIHIRSIRSGIANSLERRLAISGPNEVGECDNAGQWAKGMLLWSAIGAGVGALIGALR